MQEIGHVKITIAGEARVLRLAHGDRVVCLFRERLPITAIREVKRELERHFPRNEVLIIAGIEGFYVVPEGADIQTIVRP